MLGEKGCCGFVEAGGGAAVATDLRGLCVPSGFFSDLGAWGVVDSPLAALGVGAAIAAGSEVVAGFSVVAAGAVAAESGGVSTDWFVLFSRSFAKVPSLLGLKGPRLERYRRQFLRGWRLARGAVRFA